MKQIEIISLVKNRLQATHFMALGTADASGRPWVSPVYFVRDGLRSFYFRSNPDSIHMRNISLNPLVSLAVYESHSLEGSKVAGVQARGTAAILRDTSLVQRADELYWRASRPNEVYDDLALREIRRSTSGWLWVEVGLTELSYFDNRHFGYSRQDITAFLPQY